MFDPIELYVRMSNMDTEALIEFEQFMFKKFKDIEDTYEFVIKSYKNNTVWEEKFNDIVCALSVVRCYMIDRKIKVDFVDISKFVFHINLLIEIYKEED